MSDEALKTSNNIALDIIRNPSYFSQYFGKYYTYIISGLSDSSDQITTGEYRLIDNETRLIVINQIKDLFADYGNGPEGGWKILCGTYRPFAEARRYQRKTEYGPAIILPSQLNHKQYSEWMNYLSSNDFAIHWRVIYFSSSKRYCFSKC